MCESARDAVLVPSEDLVDYDFEEVKGYDFNNGIDYGKILEAYSTTGFQATHFGRAVNVNYWYYFINVCLDYQEDD